GPLPRGLFASPFGATGMPFWNGTFACCASAAKGTSAMAKNDVSDNRAAARGNLRKVDMELGPPCGGPKDRATLAIPETRERRAPADSAGRAAPRARVSAMIAAQSGTVA